MKNKNMPNSTKFITREKLYTSFSCKEHHNYYGYSITKGLYKNSFIRLDA